MGNSKYLVSDEQFIETAKNSFSIAEALRKMGLSQFGGSYVTFHKRVKNLNVDITHFTGSGHSKNKGSISPRRIPLDQLLIKDSSRALWSQIKRRIIAAGLLEEKCAICGLGPVWCNKKIVLQIDHINGDSLDHRIENLRLLCPNCHSQTDTFCSGILSSSTKTEKMYGVSRHKKEKIKYFCAMCNKEIKYKDSKVCKECYNSHRRELQKPYNRFRIEWPPIDELLERLANSNFWKLSKELGVSDNAIRKHIDRALYKKKMM